VFVAARTQEDDQHLQRNWCMLDAQASRPASTRHAPVRTLTYQQRPLLEVGYVLVSTVHDYSLAVREQLLVN
jgi:hypothetical protein